MGILPRHGFQPVFPNMTREWCLSVVQIRFSRQTRTRIEGASSTVIDLDDRCSDEGLYNHVSGRKIRYHRIVIKQKASHIKIWKAFLYFKDTASAVYSLYFLFWFSFFSFFLAFFSFGVFSAFFLSDFCGDFSFDMVSYL